MELIPCTQSCPAYRVGVLSSFCSVTGKKIQAECQRPSVRRKLHCQSCRQACKHDACPWWGGNNG